MIHISSSSFDYFKSKIENQIKNLVNHSNIKIFIQYKPNSISFAVNIFSYDRGSYRYAGYIGVTKSSYPDGELWVCDSQGSQVVFENSVWVYSNMETALHSSNGERYGNMLFPSMKYNGFNGDLFHKIYNKLVMNKGK